MIAQEIKEISFKTILFLKNDYQFNQEIASPPFIISSTPFSDLLIINFVYLEKPENIFSRSLCYDTLSPFVKLNYHYTRLIELLDEFKGEPIVCGASTNLLISLKDRVVVSGIENLFEKKSFKNFHFLVKVVIEETLHYFEKKTHQIRDKLIHEETKNLKCDNLSDFLKAKELIEIKYGIKEKVKEIFEVLIKEDLFLTIKALR
jgi:hypothetical protein